MGFPDRRLGFCGGATERKIIQTASRFNDLSFRSVAGKPLPGRLQVQSSAGLLFISFTPFR
jgi:hypothetical protein